MGYEAAKFGDGSASGSGNVTTQVNQHYGEFFTGKTQGNIKTEGSLKELTLDIDAAMMTAAAFPLIAPTLPAGAIIQEVFAEVSEVFILGGTTPTIDVGTETSEGTNGFDMTEAQGEALGAYDLTSALQGTWAAPLAAATTIGLALGGTTPTNGATGKMRVVIRYWSV
ncbi:MAG: hypothetical protein KUG64_11280 [Cycloclasticus sp.]|nr:hypothetical protein [Cycloclasticus sp.]